MCGVGSTSAVTIAAAYHASQSQMPVRNGSQGGAGTTVVAEREGGGSGVNQTNSTSDASTNHQTNNVSNIAGRAVPMNQEGA